MTVTTLDTSTSPLPFSQGGVNATSASSAYINLLNTSTISGTTVLSPTAYGQTIIVNDGVGDNHTLVRTITLPAVSAGKTIRFIFDNPANAKYALTPASGTINGQSLLSYGYNEGCEIYCDGTNWFVVRQALQQVSFLAYNNATQTIPFGTSSQLLFNTIVQDTTSNFTSNSFNLYYPGSYMIFCNESIGTGFTSANVSGLVIQIASTFYGQIYSYGAAGTNIIWQCAAYIPNIDGKGEVVTAAFANNDSADFTLQAGSSTNLRWATMSGYRIGNI